MKTKPLISFAVTAKLICVFVFAYADCWFSHEAAHLINMFPVVLNKEHIKADKERLLKICPFDIYAVS